MTSMPAKDRHQVNGLSMATVDLGEGTPIIFLHGNPTSSFLWRDVWPEVADLGRVIAPDLIGMGDSDKVADSGPDSYTFAQHSEHLDLLLDALVPDGPVVLVLHDWGSGLGFDWANRNRDRVAGVAYMEAIVRPVSWSEWPESARPIFESMRSEAGEMIILDKNVFVRKILPSSIQRQLTDDEMAEYLRPFADAGESRRPTLTWPRQIPIDGEPADVHERVAAYSQWMAANDIPKLFVNADPGSILTGPQREFARTWPNQREVTVKGIHFIQEDSGPEIGQAIRSWLTDAVDGF